MKPLANLKSKNRVIRAAAYARFSSDNQRDESIDAQLRAINDYAARNDIIIVEEYIDRAKSAMTDNRPSFLDMVKNSSKGEFDIVLVHKLDRFARNRYDSAHYNHQLKKNDVQLVSVIEQIDDSPEGRMMMAVLEGMAEFYSQNLAREVRKGMQENALKAMHTGGKPPLGYDVNPTTRKLVINETEAEAVTLIFQRVLEGHGYQEIVNELNSHGYKSKTGNSFCKNSIHSILSNEKYIGTYIFNRSSSADIDGRRNTHKFKDDDEIIRIENAIPPIIEKNSFDAVQWKMQKRKQEFIGHKSIETYLLSGKIICGSCGSTYCGFRRKDGRNKSLIIRYACNTKQRYGSNKCANKDIRREYIEALVLDELSKCIFDESILPTVAGYYNSKVIKANENITQSLKTLTSRLTAIDKDIDKIVELLTQASSRALLEKLSTFESEKLTLEQRIAKIERCFDKTDTSITEVSKVFNGAKKMFKEGTLSGTKKLIDLFVDKIILYEDRVEIKLSFRKKESQAIAENSLTAQESITSIIVPLADEEAINTYIFNENALESGVITNQKNDLYADNTYRRGGGEGSRTPVRKCVYMAFSECSRCYLIPKTAAFNDKIHCLVASSLHPDGKA